MKKNQIILFASGCLVLTLIKVFWQKDGRPAFDLNSLLRSLSILTATVLIFWSFICTKTPKLAFVHPQEILESCSIIGSIIISILILILFIGYPNTFNALSLEDNAVEWLSALLLFASCIIMAVNAIKTHHSGILLVQLCCAALSLVFFVIGMEEVSWFQRVLEIETPDDFSKNIQGEMNLHNFATSIVETAYYFGAFAFLVALPFIRVFVTFIKEYNFLYILMARPFIALVGSIVCCYNFNVWNTLATQVAFFGSIAVLLLFSLFSQDVLSRYIALFFMLFNITTQVIFLTHPNNFERFWAITEYKELFIALGFFIYCLDVSKELKLWALNKTN